MPPKKKKCELCSAECKSGEDVLQCSGPCRAIIHRYCAGVTLSHYKELQGSFSSFICLFCTQKNNSSKIEALQSEVDALKGALRQLQSAMSPTLSGSGTSVEQQLSEDNQSTTPFAVAISANTDKVSQRNHQTKPTKSSALTVSDRKFNIVMYGIKECPQGTAKHARMARDVKSASETIESICPDLTEHSISDCTRLGKYSSEHTRGRPILIRFTRSCDVSNILLNRRKLVNSSVFIKPYMTKAERATESILLRERRTLITNGIDKSTIKIRGNSLYVNNLKHGIVNNSAFTLCQPSTNVDPAVNNPDTNQVNESSIETPPSNSEQ